MISQNRIDSKKYVQAAEFCKLLKVSKTTFYRCVKANRLPTPIRISERLMVWPRNEVTMFINGIKNGSLKL